MQASETKLQVILEGTKQFVIPLFQRAYTWGDRREWQILWDDIMELYQSDNPRPHFIGSMVNMPTNSVPEGVSKYLVIDGQQRLTTFFVILALLRDKFRDKNLNDEADEINENFLINKFQKDSNDYFKLLPTHKFNDRDVFFSIIKNTTNNVDNKINKAYTFYEKKLKQQPDIDFKKLNKIITTYLSLVSITLDPNDNPYLVFESLNAKGTPLSHADLIRNYFFMRIHIDEQDETFRQYWEPMEKNLGDNLTEFIRHFLMKEGVIVSKSEVYFTLKEQVNNNNALDYLKELNNYSEFYSNLLNPILENNLQIAERLKRLNRIEVTTAYPLLLNFYNFYKNGTITSKEYLTIIEYLENYLIRRFISGKPSRELNKIFPAIIKSLLTENEDITNKFKDLLATKGYPKDYEFEQRFLNMKFYGGADLLTKTRLILETVESNFGHKEQSSFANLTIEHIMPQTLSNEWKEELGDDSESIREIYLHTIGNLTLSAYNSELYNKIFKQKKEFYLNSHLDINRYFYNIDKWDQNSIQARSSYLFKICNKIWSYFGSDNIINYSDDNVTGSTPSILSILNQKYIVNSWRDVFHRTLEVISDLEPELLATLEKEFPKYIGRKPIFRESRKINNEYYIEVNLAASYIFKLCNQIIDTIGLTTDDWYVEYN